MLRRCVLFKLICHCVHVVHGIIGGRDVTIEEVPYQVSYGDVCGGVLIHHKWVLTCAHCGKNHIFIRAGTSLRLKGPKVRVLMHLVHPDFGRSHAYDYDVQLLRLFRGLRFNERVAAIGLTRGSHGENIVVSGWGYLKEKGEYNNKLQQVELQIVPMNECQRIKKPFYNNSLTNRMFCAGGFGNDACQDEQIAYLMGDSGGGAVSFGYLIGLSSFGFGCGRNIPGVYMNISEDGIRSWIRMYTGI